MVQPPQWRLWQYLTSTIITAFWLSNLFLEIHPFTLPGLCPGGVRELRALSGDVQSLSTTLEMKLGLESAPAYSYVFSESCGQWLGRKTTQETALYSSLSGSGLLRSEFFLNCFNLFCCAVGLRFSLFCSTSSGTPNTIGFEERRGASQTSQLAMLWSLSLTGRLLK